MCQPVVTLFFATAFCLIGCIDCPPSGAAFVVYGYLARGVSVQSRVVIRWLVINLAANN